MRRLLCGIAAAAVLAPAALAPAAVSVNVTSAPTTDMPNFTTYTLQLVSDSGDIAAVDFGSSTFGFFGPMNQVNPSGAETVFSDFNAFFGVAVDQDSQFLVTSSDVIVVSNPAARSESASDLQAAFDLPPADQVPTFDLAQIVVPNDGVVSYSGNVAAGGQDFLVSGALAIPEPGTLALLGLGGLAMATRRRQAA